MLRLVQASLPITFPLGLLPHNNFSLFNLILIKGEHKNMIEKEFMLGDKNQKTSLSNEGLCGFLYCSLRQYNYQLVTKFFK